MDKILDFFVKVGKLKGMPRRGWVLRDIKNPETIAEHTFRAAIMAWVLADRKKKNLKIEKLLKMALVHDLCEVYSGDITPYDSILPKSKKARLLLLKTWPRFSEKKRKMLAEKKYKKEKKGLEKLIKNLPSPIKHEIMGLWLDYEKGLSPEGRFFKQTDRMESFLQSLEYWKKYKNHFHGAFWAQAKELYDDPILLEFVENMDNEFHRKQK